MRKLFPYLLAMIAVLAGGATAKGVPAEVPSIWMYYPAAVEDSPAELRTSMKAYVYFTSGSDILYAKAQVIASGEVLGTCVYRPSKPGATVMMDQSLEENAVMLTIPQGEFTISVYEVAYMADGQEQLYSDPSDPVGTVTYRRGIPNGRVVAESGFEDNLVCSYYPAGGTEGVKTITFDKPVLSDHLQATYQYGQGEVYRTHVLPLSLSDDGLTVTIDVRGLCYNVDVLAPGVTFRDDNGDPTTPPEVITLVVTGLECADGSKVETLTSSMDGLHTTTLVGQYYHNYKYRDLTFPTPVILGAEFYDTASPSERFNQPAPALDMVDITVGNIQYIDVCDVVFTLPSASCVVPAAQVSRHGQVLTVAVPDAVRVTTAGIKIGLENVTYTADDGYNHVITPLNLAYTAKDARSVAELRALAPGTGVRFSTESLTVTLSNEQLYVFAEDATGGIQLSTPDYTRLFSEGETINGTLAGTYLGNGLFMVDASQSSYTNTFADVDKGTEIDSLEALLDGTRDLCLVTLVASETLPIENIDGVAVVGGAIVVVPDFLPASYTLPQTIANVTGVLYPDQGAWYILVRNEYDINKELTSVALPVAEPATPGAVYDLGGRRIGTTPRRAGIYILDGRKVLVK